MKLWILLSCSILTTNAVAVNGLFTPSNSSENTHAVEGTARLGTPDSRFSISASFQGLKVPLISYLMNTVRLLAILALEDFSGTMESTYWDFRDYREVSIEAPPRTDGKPIERRFVVWGLSLGAGLMVSQRRFETVTFTLMWEGNEVGTIKIWRWPGAYSISTGMNPSATQGPILQSALPAADISAIAPPNSKGVNVQGMVYDTILTVQTILLESYVDLFDVFLMAVAVIVDVASREASERIFDCVPPDNVRGVFVEFYTPTAPNPDPPFFQVQWLIKAAVAIPEFMIKNGAFKEAVVRLYVDGVKVADGSLENRWHANHSPLVLSNISVS